MDVNISYMLVSYTYMMALYTYMLADTRKRAWTGAGCACKGVDQEEETRWFRSVHIRVYWRMYVYESQCFVYAGIIYVYDGIVYAYAG